MIEIKIIYDRKEYSAKFNYIDPSADEIIEKFLIMLQSAGFPKSVIDDTVIALAEEYKEEQEENQE